MGAEQMAKKAAKMVPLRSNIEANFPANIPPATVEKACYLFYLSRRLVPNDGAPSP
jgi:hypothetical protein